VPKSISGLFGGGGSVADSIPITSSLTTISPGLSLRSFRSSGSGFRSELTRTGSQAQTAEEERFPRILGDLDTLRGTLTPGFSSLRAARSAQIGNARNQALGNLRQSLSRRRVLGSSFGEQALISAEREFAEAQAASDAQSFLEELDANQRVLAFESAQINDALNRELSQLGIASGQAAQLASLNAQVSQFAANLRAQESSARGSGLGSLLGLGLSAAFSPLGGTAAGALGGKLGGLFSSTAAAPVGAIANAPIGSIA